MLLFPCGLLILFGSLTYKECFVKKEENRTKKSDWAISELLQTSWSGVGRKSNYNFELNVVKYVNMFC